MFPPRNLCTYTSILCCFLTAIKALQFEQIPEQFHYNLKYQITYSPADETSTSFILNPIENGFEEIGFGFTNSSNATILTDNATGGTFTWTVDPTILAGDEYEMIATQSGGAMAVYSTITVGSVGTSSTSSLTDALATTSATSTSSTTNVQVSNTPAQTTEGSNQGLSPGAKAGIGVGAALGVSFIGLGAFLLGRKRRSKRSKEAHYDELKVEMDGTGLDKYRHTMDINQQGPSELGADSMPGELTGHIDKAEEGLPRHELVAEPRSPQELPA